MPQGKKLMPRRSVQNAENWGEGIKFTHKKKANLANRVKWVMDSGTKAENNRRKKERRKVGNSKEGKSNYKEKK